MYEALEHRRLFASVIVGSQLRITGTTANDSIDVRQQDATTIRVSDNGSVSFFNDASVATILINGLGGNDALNIVPLNAGFSLTEAATVNGGTGNDLIRGGNGADALNGEDGDDNLFGNGGNDTLKAGVGTNTLQGGDGNDLMTAGTGKDVFNGGTGVDTANYGDRTSAVNITLDNVANDGRPISLFPLVLVAEADNVQDSVEHVTTGTGNDTISASAVLNVTNVFVSGAGNDRVNGYGNNDAITLGAGDDTGLGGAGNDNVSGGDGNDLLIGGAGNDALIGGAGNDVLNGGLGADNLQGGADNDVILALDGVADLVLDGGTGFDILERDAVDPAGVSFELVL